jgi:S1-C subfamily serine protease
MLVVPADALMTRATRLANGESVVSVESGIDVQAMTPAIARATGAGAAGGVVVSDVSSTAESSVSALAADAVAGAAGVAGASNGGASTTPALVPLRNGAAHISIGDVITTAADRPVRAPRDWQQILRAQAPGATIKLAIVRFGKPLQGSLTLPRNGAPSSSGPGASGGTGAAGAAGGAGATGPAAGTGAAVTSGGGAPAASAPSPLDVMGLTLRSVTGDSEVIAVRPASPAARAGLRTGDRITSLPGRTASAASGSPSSITIACAELASGQTLLLSVVAHDGTPRITALEKP